jgi:hypothetical protein
MGYLRVIETIGIGAALAGVAQPALAAPAEPLVVARLGEPALQVVALRDPESDAASEAVASFARALGDAEIAARQAAAQRCRGATPVPAGGKAREAWEANCRYTRR